MTFSKNTMFWFSLTAINSLWPSDTIWWQRSGSILAQVMACCLTAPSHYLNQCWLSIWVWMSIVSNPICMLPFLASWFAARAGGKWPLFVEPFLLTISLNIRINSKSSWTNVPLIIKVFFWERFHRYNSNHQYEKWVWKMILLKLLLHLPRVVNELNSMIVSLISGSRKDPSCYLDAGFFFFLSPPIATSVFRWLGDSGRLRPSARRLLDVVLHLGEFLSPSPNIPSTEEYFSLERSHPRLSARL